VLHDISITYDFVVYNCLIRANVSIYGSALLHKKLIATHAHFNYIIIASRNFMKRKFRLACWSVAFVCRYVCLFVFVCVW